MTPTEGLALAEAAPVPIDFEAKQEAIGLKRRTGGPDAKTVSKTTTKPAKVPPSEP
jgi:hypothetical protein